MGDKQHGLDMFDYVILSVLLLVSAGIGVYYRFSGGRQRTTKVFNSLNLWLCLRLKACSCDAKSYVFW